PRCHCLLGWSLERAVRDRAPQCLGLSVHQLLTLGPEPVSFGVIRSHAIAGPREFQLGGILGLCAAILAPGRTSFPSSSSQPSGPSLSLFLEGWARAFFS